MRARSSAETCLARSRLRSITFWMRSSITWWWYMMMVRGATIGADAEAAVADHKARHETRARAALAVGARVFHRDGEERARPLIHGIPVPVIGAPDDPVVEEGVTEGVAHELEFTLTAVGVEGIGEFQFHDLLTGRGEGGDGRALADQGMGAADRLDIRRLVARDGDIPGRFQKQFAVFETVRSGAQRLFGRVDVDLGTVNRLHNGVFEMAVVV